MQAFKTGDRVWRSVLPMLAICGIASCGAAPKETAGIVRAIDVADAPPGADPNACFARHVRPAIIETVTEQVLVQPPQIGAGGAVTYPAVYRSETRQEIVRERKELWFETLCEEMLTPDFISALQRALGARGYFRGTVSGRMDSATRKAIRAYQQEQGVDSDILSIAAARQLGLAVLPREMLVQ